MAICEKPYIKGPLALPCTTCDICRIRRKKLWAIRIMLESYVHGDSSFVTLTYDDEHLPPDGSLVPDDAQSWLKRLRLAIEPRKVRYFLSGEYGDESWRPHYHATVFGLSLMDEGTVRDTWKQGHVMLGTLTPHSASYVAGYVTKKMSKKDVVSRGLYPEFTRMSLKPGIGAEAMKAFAEALSTDHGLDDIAEQGDVPYKFRHDGKFPMLGRYLRSRLRKELGYGPDTPKETLQKYEREMLNLLKEDVDFTPFETRDERRTKIANYYVDKNAQVMRNIKARAEIFAQKKEI